MNRKPLSEPLKAINSTDDLVGAGLVSASQRRELKQVEESFVIRLTPQVLSQIKQAHKGDPIYAQYVPSAQELHHKAGELQDPIGDDVFEKCKGITHRYPDRVLLKPTHTCQVYCRFCFRREQVGHANQALNPVEMDHALQYIRENEGIWEVILTGGDPLVLSDRRLGDLLSALGEIDHISVIRIHTRVPLVVPDRLTAACIEALKRAGKTVCFVVHVNHGNELSEAVTDAFARLADHGFPLLSQTVLLKGVNDDSTALATLFRTLMKHRVKPYYLHHLDKARGVDHFRVSIERGQALMAELRGRVSGICLPTYVLDIPGGYGKVPIGPNYLVRRATGGYVVSDYLGGCHTYTEPSVQPMA